MSDYVTISKLNLLESFLPKVQITVEGTGNNTFYAYSY